MATRGSIPKMMETAGIDMLPPAAGVPVVRRELDGAGAGGEVVVAGRAGRPARGAARDRRPRPERGDRRRRAGPMVGTVTPDGRATGCVVETDARPGRAALPRPTTASTARRCCPA